MRGYKILGPNYTFNGYTFQENNKCTDLEIYTKGFWFYPRVIDCLEFSCFDYTPYHTYVEVESQGKIQIVGDRVHCTEINIIRKLSYVEFGQLLTGIIKRPMFERSYVAGRKHGIFKTYYSNGKLSKQCVYKNDKLDGQNTEYYENGIMSKQCVYEDNILRGPYKEYYTNGIMSKECLYLNNILEGIYKSWYDNGQLFQICSYSHGKKYEYDTRWYSCGKIKEKCMYAKGKLHGLSKKWHECGKLEEECMYKMGKLHGLYKKWVPGGITTECMYKNGKVHESCCVIM